MKSFEQFGLPLPIRVSNPYLLSPERLLNGIIPVPEGPVASACTSIGLWLEHVAAIWRHQGFPVEICEEGVPQRYTIRLEGEPLEETTRKQLMESIGPIFLRPPSLWTLCGEIREKLNRVDGVELYDFAEMLEENLPSRSLCVLKNRFPEISRDSACTTA